MAGSVCAGSTSRSSNAGPGVGVGEGGGEGVGTGVTTATGGATEPPPPPHEPSAVAAHTVAKMRVDRMNYAITPTFRVEPA